ncbi:MAG: hypothetical protein FRX49_07386 [Trebouxia sp. A1-2]|nr:MAG: hypothetical protein FRX49_07386 [Trebouxia sp. A1-2]
MVQQTITSASSCRVEEDPVVIPKRDRFPRVQIRSRVTVIAHALILIPTEAHIHPVIQKI